MGNIFQVQCGDALIGRCWDCVARQPLYICDLEENLKALQTARDELSELRNDVMRTIINEQGAEMVQLDRVRGWLSRADSTLARVTILLSKASQETQKLCLAGCCSNNCKSTYIFGKSVAQSLKHVVALKAEGDFKQVVIKAPVDQLEANLEALKIAREELIALKEDVTRRVILEEGPQMKPLQQVQLWLLKAEKMISEADQLVRDGPQEIEKLRLLDFSSYSFVGTAVAKMLEDTFALKANGNFEQVVDRALPEAVVERNQKPIMGTEAMLEEAWSCLLKDEVDTIGIYGMGGVGKTTLLTQLNNKFANTSNNFDVVIWAVVSKDLKLEKVQEDIWKRIGSFNEDWAKQSISDKAADILYALKKKKFALLLDDMWEQVKLEEIGVPLPKNGSKAVFTTRSIALCRQMGAKEIIRVRPLNLEEAWLLFHKKVGNIDQHVLPLAKMVAIECCGLPIALIAIAGTMASRNTPEEWEHALEVLRRSSSSLQGMEDEIYQEMEVHVFKRLKFSYDSLPNDVVRSCFLYCSLFPEDFTILRDDLVHYWICERFCGRNEGFSIIGTLIRLCLLEEEGECIKMHDVIRDMALWIACECEKEKEAFFVQAGAQLTQVPEIGEWEKPKRMSLMANSFKDIQAVPKCCELVTLFLGNNQNLGVITNGFFQFMDNLTVLDMSKTDIEELPMEIWKLKSLQYLNLSHTKLRQLPTDLKMLTKLKYLNLEDTVFLEMIPRQVMASLLSLEVLRMLRCGNYVNEEWEDNILIEGNNYILIDELSNLENLNELSITIRSGRALQSFFMTIRLLNCTRAIQIAWLQGTKSLNISTSANMKHLNTLQISGNCDLEEIDIMLKNTIISRNVCFNSLREVIVESNFRLRELTWLVLVPNLSTLRVKYNHAMEEIISAKRLGELHLESENLNLFEKLQVLELFDMRNLKSIYWNGLSFPVLERVEVFGCRNLKKLPLNSHSAKGCKVVIIAQKYWWNNVVWEDAATQATFSSCFRKR